MTDIEHSDDCFLSGGDDGRWPCICGASERRASEKRALEKDSHIINTPCVDGYLS